MPRKKKKPAAQKPAPMQWEFGPDIPTHDFLEEGPLDDPWNLQQAVENFVSWVEEGQFLTWEAVVCEEQGLSLTAGQKKALRSLLSFNDEEDDQILYIDEIRWCPATVARWCFSQETDPLVNECPNGFLGVFGARNCSRTRPEIYHRHQPGARRAALLDG